jgi:phage tail protein X
MATKETLVVASDATTLDLLLWRRFMRAIPGMVERTLDINPGLPRLGVVLPIGTRVEIEVPEASDQASLPVVSLWD